MEGEREDVRIPCSHSRAEERATRHLARIISLIDAAIVAVDRDGKISLWNPAAASLFGVEGERALGQSLLEVGFLRDPAPVVAALASTAEATLEGVAVLGPDGRSRHVRLRLVPLAGGEVQGTLIVGTDETEERKRVEQLAHQKLSVESLNAALRRQAQTLVERHRELEVKNELVAAASRAKSEFIANMSHELRTPLNSIRGFCRLLHDGAQTSESEAREFLEIIDRNGQELLTLIDDILELAKADAGRLDVGRTSISIPDLATDIVSELKPLAQEKGITLRVEVSPGVGQIATDALKVQRIVRNLAVNAIKFTTSGSVEVRVRPSKLGGARIDVIDTGIGIAPEDQARIWDPFEQVDGSNSRRYGGTGLGLSIVRRLTELLGGELSVESSPGSGSRFSVELPAESPEAIGPAGAAGLGIGVGGVVVAGLADPDTYRALDRALGEVGLAGAWEPDPAEVVRRARALAKRRTLAAVVVDLASGSGEARTALADLAADPLTARTRFFALVSGHLEEARLTPGAPEFVASPADPRQLARRIAAVLRERPDRPESPEVDSTEPRTPSRSFLPPGRMASPASDLLARVRRPPRSERLVAAAPDALAGRDIVVVEDNEDSARLAQLLLEQRGCQVRVAPDAGHALALLQRHAPDAVIMDLMLPGLDGYDATRAIRSMPERARIPIVAATAAVLPGDKARALEAGCDDVVAKPYDADELVARLAAAIARRTGERAGPAGLGEAVT
jgi:two-component system chemotaxis sensor kinase CheA